MSLKDNPVSTTWKFTIRINDTVDPTDVMELPKALVHIPRVQFAHWHQEKWSSDAQPFVRGILRCVKPTSHKMVSTYLPDGNFKPLRGVFTVSRINYELKPLNRVGEVYSIGSVISNKRPLEDKSCPTCGSKKPKTELKSSPPSESVSEDEDDNEHKIVSGIAAFLSSAPKDLSSPSDYNLK